DSGRNGLPGLSIISPQFKAGSDDPSSNKAARSVEFMISIDEEPNELLIDGREKDVAAAMKLLKAADRIDPEDSRTYIKTSTRFACQVADQLPAEIERIRA